MRRASGKPYRFIRRKSRPIEVIFRHIPGKRFSSGTYDMTEAVLFAEAFMENEGFARTSIPLLSAFAKDFFIRSDSGCIKARLDSFGKSREDIWYKENQQRLERYIIPRFGSYKIDSIMAPAIESWIAGLQGIKKEKLSGNYRRKILDTFSYVMDDAVRHGYISDNPLDKVTPITERQVIERRALTIYEQKRLFPTSADERIIIWGSVMWATYFSFLYDTGFRPGEISGLRVCDIYTTPNGYGIYTTHSLDNRTHKPKERVKTTGKGMERRVGLLSDISGELANRLIDSDSLTDEDWLFLMDRQDAESWMRLESANKHMKAVLMSQGISTENVTQYSLRHTYATYRKGNMDDATLALSMGHSGGTIRDDYDHRTASILLAQLEKSRDDIFRKDEEKDTESITPLKVKDS